MNADQALGILVMVFVFLAIATFAYGWSDDD